MSTGDVDGDGLDDLVVSGHLDDAGKLSFPSYVIPASALAAADRADGAHDRAVHLELAAEQDGSLALMSQDRSFLSAIADVDGDGLGDVVFANGGARGNPRWGGAAWLASGSYLHSLGTTASPVVLDELEPDGAGLWKFVGAGAERLGYGKPLAASLDDGALDLILGSYGALTYYRSSGSRLAPGTAVALSTRVLDETDAADGISDGVIRMGSLWGEYSALILDSLQVTTTQFDENLIVMDVSGETGALMRYGVGPDQLAPKLYEIYEDVFDYLVFQNNIPLVSRPRSCAYYVTIGNAVGGTGVSKIDYRSYWGSGGKLTGVAGIEDRRCLDYNTLAHEIMHTWANFVLPSSGSGPHWGFTSANGLLGGFDRSKLVDLGDDRYAAGRFNPRGTWDNKPYSPIELYLAGWLPADEVPAIWVASDARWAGEDEEHGWTFTASQVEDWSVERIIEERGQRTPTVDDSQKAFRAAFVLVTDRENPPEQEVLEELSALVRGFSNPANDADDGTFNFYEATGGRATFSTAQLTRWRKSGTVVPLAKSVRNVRTLVANQSPRYFGHASKRQAHRLCGVEHGHWPAQNHFSSVDRPRALLPIGAPPPAASTPRR